MRRIARLLPICLALSLCAFSAGCGYSLRGEANSLSSESVLGDGTKTLSIQNVEQSTLYPWLPYTVRSSLRDGIHQRGLARLTEGASDYSIRASLTSCSISNSNNASGASFLYTVRIAMTLSIRDGHTNAEIWNSGTIGYSNSFQSESESEAVRQVVGECVRIGLDRLQQRF